MKNLIIIMCIVLSATAAGAANRILFEDFNDGDIDAPLQATEENGATFDTFPTNCGPSGTGRCVQQDPVVNSEPDPTLNYFPSGWTPDAMYFSGYLRYTEGPTEGGGKIFYPHWAGASSYVHVALSDSYTLFFSAKDKNFGYLTGLMKSWYGVADVSDGNWHRFEFYIQFSATPRVRIWVDGLKEIDTNGVSSFASGGIWADHTIYYVSFPSITAGGADTSFTRQVDNWEVWDECPDTSGYSCSADAVDIYTPYIDAGSIQPGIDETGVDANADIEFRVVDSQGNLDNLLENHSRFYFTVEPQ